MRYSQKKPQNMFYDPRLAHKGGPGVNLTDILDSLCMVSYYLPLRLKALKAIINEIKAKNIKSAIL